MRPFLLSAFDYHIYMRRKIVFLVLLLLLQGSEIIMCGDKKVTEKPVVINPPGDIKAVVIWLHGLGADGHDFEAIVDELGLPADSGIRFVFPHAPMRPITINGGYVMRGWYDIMEEDLSQQEDEQGIRESAEMISKLIRHEMQLHSLPANRILIAGFSQGGVIVLHTALRFPDRLAGVMALSTYLGLANSLENERHIANNDIDIFMAHGRHDPIIAIEHAQQSRDRLEELGYRVNWKMYRMEHSVVPDEIDDIGGWLRQRLID